MMLLTSLARFLNWRLRGAWVQDLLAAAGIATGVALMFAVVVSNSSITAGARDILTGIGGDAQLQLTARSADGVDEAIVRQVREVPGVETAAPLLEQRVTLTYGGRRAGVELIGLDTRLGDLSGIASTPLLTGLLSLPQLFLPSAVGEALKLPDIEGRHDVQVQVEARGLGQPVRVSEVLDSAVIGPLAAGNVAGTPLARAQAFTGLPGRVTRILVRTKPGTSVAVRERLQQLAGSEMAVGTLDDELALLHQASLPNDQATSLFAAIGVVIGLLLAYTAVLLTIPERRELVAEHHMNGTSRGRIAQIVLFPALMLGIVAGLAGVAGGLLLLRFAATDPPGYLSFAWPLGHGQHVTATVVIGAVLAGIALSVLAAAQPLLDLRGNPSARQRKEATEAGQAVAPALRARAAIGGVAITALAIVLALLVPALTVVAVAALVLATMLLLPAVFSAVLLLVRRWPRRDRESMTLAAERDLRVTSLRSLALAATAAVAIFGTVAMEGARGNLLTGLYQDYREYIASGDIWITQHGDDLALSPINITPAAVAGTPGVAAVRAYQGGFVDLGHRRVWLQGRDAGDRPMIPPSQVLEGDEERATALLRSGGWLAVSEQIADQMHVTIGDPLTLETPSGPRTWRVAAITTNLGWGPGAIVLRRDEYARAWRTTTPTALQIDLRAGADPQRTVSAIRQALGPAIASAVRVQTRAQRASDANGVARAGLARLSQIATALLVAAVLALGAALSTTIWQRRRYWAERNFDAFPYRRSLQVVLIEATLILGTGCLLGAAAGTLGHWLLGRWLQQTTGYPAPFAVSVPSTALTCAELIVAALVLTSFAANRAIRAPARLALDPDN